MEKPYVTKYAPQPYSINAASARGAVFITKFADRGRNRRNGTKRDLVKKRNRIGEKHGKKFLENLDLGNGVKLSKEAIDAVMAENGKDIEAKKALTTAETAKLTTENQTIKDLQDAVKKFDGVDAEKLRGDLTALQTKYDTDTAKLKVDSALEIALRDSKVKNSKLVKNSLDREQIKLDGEKLLGLNEQLEALKKRDPDSRSQPNMRLVALHKMLQANYEGEASK